jgi:hypothetical protein
VIRRLPDPERLRLMERVIHEVAQQLEPPQEAKQAPIIGLFSEEPALMEAVADEAMSARELDPLRRRGS